MTDQTQMELVDGDAILITRSFNAPLALVFKVLHEPALVARWWAPRSRGKMTSCEIDFRVGGAWRFVMVTNDGMEVGFSGRYQEIEAPTRVVNTEIFDPFPDAAAVVTLTLHESGGRTTLKSLSRYPSAQIRDQVIASGMEGGMRESMVQLSEVVAAQL